VIDRATLEQLMAGTELDLDDTVTAEASAKRLTAALGNSTVHVYAQHDAQTDKHRLRIERHHHGNVRATVIDADFVHGADYAALAGAAMTFKEFTLSNGQRLRIATNPVKLASGAVVSPNGLTPDIQVNVAAAEEKIYWNDPYALWSVSNAATNNPSSTTTNRVTRRVRTNEADLVRARRQGLNLDEDSVRAREPEPEIPVIRDPALGRAVDLLKGLAVVRRTP